MASHNYHPEPYWNDVARRLAIRNHSKLIAGDDEPYYHYKRQQFLKQFHTISFANKTVLEIGCGPGGNLLEVDKQQPRSLYGVDISDEMIAIAKQTIAGKNVQIQKVDGITLPFTDSTFDLSFTSTVLQHNTDEAMLEKVISEISRVTKSDIYIFERIEPTIKGTELCLGRPAAYYETLFSNHHFALMETTFLNIQVSYFVAGAIRKLFNNPNKKEGEPVSAVSRLLQSCTLPLTAALDPFVKQKRELAMLHFKKQ